MGSSQTAATIAMRGGPTELMLVDLFGASVSSRVLFEVPMCATGSGFMGLHSFSLGCS